MNRAASRQSQSKGRVSPEPTQSPNLVALPAIAYLAVAVYLKLGWEALGRLGFLVAQPQ